MLCCKYYLALLIDTLKFHSLLSAFGDRDFGWYLKSREVLKGINYGILVFWKEEAIFVANSLLSCLHTDTKERSMDICIYKLGNINITTQSIHIILAVLYSQKWPFASDNNLVYFFLGIEHLSSFQLTLVAYSSLCRVEARWPIPITLAHLMSWCI